MSHLRQTVLTISLAAVAVSAWAQTAAEIDAQHKQHQAHVLATEQSSANQPASPADPTSAGTMAAIDSKMKAMDEMHKKMMATKTPEEKKALMAEHMKTMQEGMKMTGMMGSAGMPAMKGKKGMTGNMEQHHQMMEKRMAMMESMMQMMMDRMSAPATN
jgi:hypothetical protein